MRELSPMMQLAWSAAAAEAAASGHEFIETEHVLIGMTAVSKALPLAADGLGFSAEQLHDAAREQDILRQVLAKTLVAPEAMRRELRKALGGTGGGPRDGRISRSAACKAVFASAAELSDYKPSVTALQFLKAALLNQGHALKQALEQLGNTAFQLSEALDAAETSAAPAASERLAPGEPKRHHFPSNPLWGKAGTDLVYLASCGYIGESSVNGKELARLSMCFERKGAKIPLLVGRRGIGKNTMVRALALKLWHGKAPPLLADKTIVEITLPGLENACPSRQKAGELIKAALLDNNDSAVIYLRGLRNFIAPDRAHIFDAIKPAMASRKTLFIADIDEEGFKQLSEKMPSLAKNFEPIPLPEPGKRELGEILRGRQPELEKIHSTRISDSAIASAVELAFTLNLGEPVPAAALNLLAKACSRAAGQNLKNGISSDSVSLAATAEKHGLDMAGDVNEALITAVAAEKTGISLDLVAAHTHRNSSSPSELFNLEHSLDRSVMGQHDVVVAVSDMVRKYLGLEKGGAPARKKPLALLFLGPSGVGKTALASALGRIVSAGKDDTAVFDLSATGGDKLLEIGGPLRRTLRLNPFRTVLFQHAESADPAFYEELAVFLSSREMSTKDDTVVDIGNSIFILSTNHFAFLQDPTHEGYEKSFKNVMKGVKAFFPLALLEQFDGVLIFRHLDDTTCTRLLLGWIDEMRVKVKEAGSELHVGREVERFLITKGEIGKHGAKKLRTAFEEMFAATLNALLEKGEIERHPDWRALVADYHISFVPKIYESQKKTSPEH